MAQRFDVLIRSFFMLTPLVAGISVAAALDRGKTEKLDMTVGPPGMEQSFGKFGAYMQRLKLSGQACSFSGYDYGMNIACGDANAEPRVYIDVVYQPTHGPDIAYVSEIRPNGRNGGYLPVADHVKFLKEFAPARLMKRSR
ncbi:hypothetical protein PY365_19760 [Roseiarcaceae bacterium H3SJ34-1]|uniref:hypothetical protein n=1 Tax=Terripilifer ovatus TaxID=3032367 RepID=UPI003AB972D1|nr:hypothetical protein [Roseiarcaceae bacterium H3SJ34-1]